MFNLFKCKHPAAYLTIYSTKPVVEDVDQDFERVTFRMHCIKCNTQVDKSAMTLKGSVEEFLNRKHK